jgi:hypothetical protein
LKLCAVFCAYRRFISYHTAPYLDIHGETDIGLE